MQRLVYKTDCTLLYCYFSLSFFFQVCFAHFLFLPPVEKLIPRNLRKLATLAGTALVKCLRKSEVAANQSVALSLSILSVLLLQLVRSFVQDVVGRLSRLRPYFFLIPSLEL